MLKHNVTCFWCKERFQIDDSEAEVLLTYNDNPWCGCDKDGYDDRDRNIDG